MKKVIKKKKTAISPSYIGSVVLSQDLVSNDICGKFLRIISIDRDVESGKVREILVSERVKTAKGCSDDEEQRAYESWQRGATLPERYYVIDSEMKDKITESASRTLDSCPPTWNDIEFVDIAIHLAVQRVLFGEIRYSRK